MLNFLVGMLATLFRARYRRFATFDEALAFLKSVDITIAAEVPEKNDDRAITRR